LGLIGTSWGGTPIEVWMSPAALAACGEGVTPPATLAATASVDPGILGSPSFTLGGPTLPSTLYYSMIYPWLATPITALLWYQGESNAGNPTGETCARTGDGRVAAATHAALTCVVRRL